MVTTMAFEPHLVVGYAPTIDEIMEDLRINNPADFRETVLSRCKQLYQDAKHKGNLDYFETSHEFVVCDSSDFYQTLVNMGHGNSSLVISDDYSPDVYFLMFADKVPVQFRPVVASHESSEYTLVNDEELEQRLAHRKASEVEMETADKLGVKEGYLDYLKTQYPTKLNELKEWDIV